MIKKFELFNESIKWTENEQKALDLGYNIGDIVYNKKMKKQLEIIRNAKHVIEDKRDNYCTLASIGEFPDNYRLIKTIKDKDDKPTKEKEDTSISISSNKLENWVKKLSSLKSDDSEIKDIITDIEKLLK